jgi:general secretion pathway protein E
VTDTDTLMPGDDAAWMQRLAAARSEHRAGGGTVLDALLRHWPADAASLLGQLEPRFGVGPIDQALPWTPASENWTAEQSRQHQCVVLRGPVGSLVAAAADPWAPSVHRAVERALGASVPLVAASGAQLLSWQQGTSAASAHVEATPQDVQGPIVSFVEGAIRRAIAISASDIHFECNRSGVTVKHRLDGVMQSFARMEGVASAEAVI